MREILADVQWISDKDKQTTLEAVHNFARYLGMEPEKDKEYLWIAVEAMAAPLPENWAEFKTQDGQSYYYNRRTEITQWYYSLSFLLLNEY